NIEEKEELQGYLHDVSTVKKSEKVPYFDMCIQTESGEATIVIEEATTTKEKNLRHPEDFTITKAKWIKCTAEWDVIDWFSSRSNYWLLCKINPRTILKFKNELALAHPKYVCEQLNCFAILLIDDHHNVHAKKVSTKLITSTATHMASCLWDIHPTIPAAPHPQQTPVHRAVRITIKGAEVTCYSAIENRVIQQKMHQDLVIKDIVYKELSNEGLSTLETCQLISGREQSLKSAQNYRECFQKLLQECPPLGNYLNKNVIPWPADWTDWYYPKKNIALGKCSHLRQSFYVSLNAAEDAVTIFKHFFERLFKTVFGTDLPHKPKPYKVTLCLTAALLGIYFIYLLEQLLDKKLQFLSLITEKKVEIFHSLLRENTREHDDAKSLSEIAKVIASSGFLSALKEGKTAGFLLDLFKKISSNSGKAHKVTQERYSNGKPKGKGRYYLPTFETEVITWIRCSVVLNLTQHVSVIPQSATITVASGFMCCVVLFVIPPSKV
ncbi:hypothetical protein P5673_031651, partial [Acropora cervicornis]